MLKPIETEGSFLLVYHLVSWKRQNSNALLLSMSSGTSAPTQVPLGLAVVGTCFASSKRTWRQGREPALASREGAVRGVCRTWEKILASNAWPCSKQHRLPQVDSRDSQPDHAMLVFGHYDH